MQLLSGLPAMRAGAAVCAVALSGACLAQPATLMDEQQIRKAAVASFPEYLEFLTLPNDALAGGDDLKKNAQWLAPVLEKRGFSVRQVDNNGRPIVFAALPSDPAKKTVLFYFHFDGQPVIPAQWAQPSPWKPVLKAKAADGSWSVLDMQQLLRQDFDPEHRVFARAASDDKGPILMFLAALDLMRSHGVAPAVNVKLILDSEEEINSPGLGAAIGQQAAFLAADALVIHDGPGHASGRPTAVFGNRGAQAVTLTVFGPKAPQHSGHYGNYLPNPALKLARLLAAMKDAQGRVLIPGYYGRTSISAADKRILARSGDDEAAIRRRIGFAAPDRVADNYQEALQYPSLNIRGMAAGGVGKLAANIVPKEAVAEIDIRTTVEADAPYLTALLRKFIEQQGYVLLDHEPTDDERARHPLMARMVLGLPAAAARQPMDSEVRDWVERALVNAHMGAGAKAEPVLLRAMGGTVPTNEIVAPLKLPFALVCVVNADNNQHAYDENLRMGNYLTGMRSMLGLLNTPYTAASKAVTARP
ncbi:MAG: M20/M25/M40 family metallo-hydrolase [Pseudomonadota bacterium]